MSHRDNCPTRWQAEREGQDAFARGAGRYSNPYDRSHGGSDHCRDADRAWEDGHRQAERHAEEEAIQRRQDQRRAQEREWARQKEEASYWRQQEEEQAQQMEEEYAAAIEAQQAEQYFWMEQDQLREMLS